ncbi:MAG: tRNA-intron lyase [Candidatus Methanomethylophilaceae archaeon]
MAGELIDDLVVIVDQKEGSQIYNKGNYGYPMSGNGIELDLIEATYLLESSRLRVIHEGEEMCFEELFNYSSSVFLDFDVKYMVYRDLRQRGFVVKVESGNFDLSVFPRGMMMSNSRPIYLVRAVSERTAFDINTFTDDVSETETKGKRLLYGVVDEEGDLTYYIMAHRDPKGEIYPKRCSKKTVGRLIRDRVFIFDADDAIAIRESGFYGKMIENMLQLSLIESCYLMDRDDLSVISDTGNRIELGTLLEFGRSTQDEFDLRLKAFSDARDRGLVVKTGFKYGAHFRAYEKSPDDCHARYLIHAVSASNVTMWPEISRAVRLSGGVKKEFLFSHVSDRIEYLEFKWFRP